MEELTLETLIAVFEEMFGRGLFWVLAILAVLVLVMMIGIVLKDKKLGARRMMWSQLWAPLGAVGAVWFVLAITKSQLNDMGGAVDILMLVFIAFAGAVGTTLVAYVLQTFWFKARG